MVGTQGDGGIQDVLIIPPWMGQAVAFQSKRLAM